ncbi:M20/M25/M40 family metallo-hydrolase [bacterium]|nr:M20/M25/M40 family metallo-hydrolase [bacterium]
MSGFDFREACRRAISIDSTSSHGNDEYVEFLKGILDKFDLKVRTEPVDADGYRGVNLIAEKGGGPDVILFDTHLDTVSPGDPARWTETGGDPFRATVRDGNIYGLGTADVKLDFLCKLKALEPTVGKRFCNRFILLGTFGEEVGLIGARAFLANYTGQLDFALVGEPTSLKLVNRHKGRGCYAFKVAAPPAQAASDLVKVEFSGKAAHSSTPHKGVNAIEQALDLMAGLDVPPDRLHIDGGHLLNIIPDRCVVVAPRSAALLAAVRGRAVVSTHAGRVDLRDTSGLWPFWRALREERRQISPETSWACVTARTSADENAFIFEFDSRYWEEAESFPEAAFARVPAAGRVIRKDASFFETSSAWHVESVFGALRESGIEPEYVTKMGSTEAALFGQRCTALVFGPGQSEGNIHSPNEHNRLADLDTAIRAYEAILRRLVVAPAG